MRAKGKIRIGISGWRYKPWRGVFYPAKLPQAQELKFASQIFSSLEINGTFYSLQRPTSFQNWYASTPPDFLFSVKGPRYLTHMQRLRGVQSSLANFFASGVLLLGEKLGPFLWQLPPNFKFEHRTIDQFLRILPRDIASARRLARKHEKWLTKRASFEEINAKQDLRHAIEIRHPSFAVPRFIELLRKHQVALVCADTVEWPRITDVSSDFVYCRLHGSEELYASGYDAKALDQWADWIRRWAGGGQPDSGHVLKENAPKHKARDVFVYFDNDTKVRAPFDAQALIKRLVPE